MMSMEGGPLGQRQGGARIPAHLQPAGGPGAVKRESALLLRKTAGRDVFTVNFGVSSVSTYTYTYIYIYI